MKLGRDPIREPRFIWREALARAESVLSEPPAVSRIQRPERRGELVQRFVLPLTLCPTTNRTRHTIAWQHARDKAHLLTCLRSQMRGLLRAEAPLPGRPQVLCMRLSTVEPDVYSDWAKRAVDALCVPAARRKDGLGFLRDDRPKDIELVQWWEPAKRGEGFVYIEIRSGE